VGNAACVGLLAHRFVLTLHLLIGLVGQPDLCFGSLVQLEPPFGSNQIPVEEAIEKRHLCDQQAPYQALAAFLGLERELVG